jgi:hypothetical protein
LCQYSRVFKENASVAERGVVEVCLGRAMSLIEQEETFGEYLAVIAFENRATVQSGIRFTRAIDKGVVDPDSGGWNALWTEVVLAATGKSEQQESGNEYIALAGHGCGLNIQAF